MEPKKSAVVVGAGIVGIAITRALLNAGYKVTVLEKSISPQGASIRNFGMFWPIGQQLGEGLELAARSRKIWLSLRDKAGFRMEETGSLHLAYSELEADVIQQYVQHACSDRSAHYLSPDEVKRKVCAIEEDGLKGALWSEEEMLMDPREAMAKLIRYFEAQDGIEFCWNTPVSSFEKNRVYSGKRFWQADMIFLCMGSDWGTLLPEYRSQFPLVTCKLQMMRTISQPTDWKLPIPLAFGLSLIHYRTFQVAPSLHRLKDELADRYPNFMKWGVHVMAAQNVTGEITIGDTHQYGDDLSPFDHVGINQEILDFLLTRLKIPHPQLQHMWHGVYAKPTDGSGYFFSEIAPGIWVLNGLGGAGMTLSFGLAEFLIGRL